MTRFTDLRHIHLIGVGGTGMGAFAGLLRQAGHDVTGSDTAVYPPMSHKLAQWGIDVMEGYRPQNLTARGQPPDLTVVGNVIRRENPEAAHARDAGFNQASFPQALGAMFLANRPSVVVSGTHGKTTTTAMLAHALDACGLDPGMLVGGVPQGMGESFRLGAPGAPFVVEGDEYDTAYFDKGPKFLHYKPHHLIITSIEYDHADIYPDVETIEQRFHQLAALVPRNGSIMAWAGSPRTVAVATRAAASGTPATLYGDGGELTADNVEESPQGARFGVHRGGVALGSIALRLSGRHNVDNALAALGVLLALNVPFAAASAAMGSFAGVKRRLEELGQPGGVLLIDDFAHHPTAVRATVAAARERYAARLADGAKLWSVFEPRSATSCRRVFQKEYAQAFGGSDHVVVAQPGRKGTIAEDQLFSVEELVADLTAGGQHAVTWPDVPEIVAQLGKAVRKGDVVLIMSNGSFGGLHGLLAAQLEGRL